MVVDRINKPSHSTHEREGYFWGAVLNPLHPCGWSPRLKEYPLGLPEFQSTPPLRVETRRSFGRSSPDGGFNPHHPREMETSDSFDLKSRQCFNPRHPQRTAAFLLRYTQFFDLRGVVPSDGLQSGDFGLDFFHVLRHLV